MIHLGLDLWVRRVPNPTQNQAETLVPQIPVGSRNCPQDHYSYDKIMQVLTSFAALELHCFELLWIKPSMNVVTGKNFPSRVWITLQNYIKFTVTVILPKAHRSLNHSPSSPKTKLSAPISISRLIINRKSFSSWSLISFVFMLKTSTFHAKDKHHS